MEQSAEGIGESRRVSNKKVRVVRKSTSTSSSKKKSKKSVLSQDKVEELVLEHRENGRKLARSILRKWRVRMPIDEIDSIVDLSLCEAARRYDSSKGAAFMTFYFYHLRGHLVRAVAKAAQASNIFMAFAKNTGIDTSEWNQVDAETVWGYVPDESVFGQREVETPENSILRIEKIEECRDAVAKLDALEQEIIKRSFSEEQPLVDIAKSLGYSRCHISRVKKSALERLKTMIAAESGQNDTAVRDNKSCDRLCVERSKTPRVLTRRRSRRRTIKTSTPSSLEVKVA
jgi:RNA polymerase sigma factor (sigma-70 family)